MGRAPCCDKANVKKGPWSPEEDAKLKSYIQQNGTGGNWIALPQKIGLKRCGKSCRLRWLNYLRPNIKHGGFSEEEDNIICSLYITIGSRWSIIAAQLPGRTDNDIKNYWNTRLKKKLLGKQPKGQPLGRSLIAPAANLNQHIAAYWPELPCLAEGGRFSDTSTMMYSQDQTYVNSSFSTMFSNSYAVNNMFEGFGDFSTEILYGNDQEQLQGIGMGSLCSNGVSSVGSSSWGNNVSSLDYSQLVSEFENCLQNLPQEHASFEISSFFGPK